MFYQAFESQRGLKTSNAKYLEITTISLVQQNSVESEMRK